MSRRIIPYNPRQQELILYEDDYGLQRPTYPPPAPYQPMYPSVQQPMYGPPQYPMHQQYGAPVPYQPYSFPMDARQFGNSCERKGRAAGLALALFVGGWAAVGMGFPGLGLAVWGFTAAYGLYRLVKAI
jgi:hypothetical protein